MRLLVVLAALSLGCATTVYKSATREILVFKVWPQANLELKIMNQELCLGCLESAPLIEEDGVDFDGDPVPMV